MEKLTKVINGLTTPILNNFGRFLSLIFLQSFALVFYVLFVSTEGLTTYQVCFHIFTSLVYSFSSSYVIILLTKYLPRIWGKVLYTVFLIYISLIFVTNIYCLWTIKYLFNADYVGIVLGTNINEATEFFTSAYLNGSKLVGIVLCLLAPIAASYLFKYVANKCRLFLQAKGVRVSLLIIFCITLEFNYKFKETLAGQQSAVLFYQNFEEYEPTPEIKLLNPKLNTQSQSNVQTIVVIVGESLSKNHCSLYGYKQLTNPKLSAYSDSLLHTFSAVTAAATHTEQAFERLMTTVDDSNASDWYKSPNIIEIAGKAGYKTAWISNQSKHGLFENKVAKMAELSDTTMWNGNKFTGLRHDEIDDELIPIATNYHLNAPNNLIFIHLMGSHADFNQRYPARYAKFTAADYNEFPAEQRQDRAEYDNSVLFNDYVVSSLINIYAKQDAVIMYFSDHALDIYDTSDDYCGHAIEGDKKSNYYGRQIPFLIYTSAEFRQKHSDLTQLIENATDKQINTTDLPYIIMQLMGVTFADLPNKAIL
jgi:glucan phosphoethanolaminetransferase (alkaline phosphatase superfamily)